MMADFTADFPLTNAVKDSGIRHYSGAAGRIQFFLKENPERRIWHTLQVEKNGFIHGILTSTPLQDRGYEYLGKPCYIRWIAE